MIELLTYDEKYRFSSYMVTVIEKAYSFHKAISLLNTPKIDQVYLNDKNIKHDINNSIFLPTLELENLKFEDVLSKCVELTAKERFSIFYLYGNEDIFIETLKLKEFSSINLKSEETKVFDGYSVSIYRIFCLTNNIIICSLKDLRPSNTNNIVIHANSLSNIKDIIFNKKGLLFF